MTTTPRAIGAIDDDQIEESRAAMRGLLVDRLEAVWATVAPHVGREAVEEAQALEARMDPRWAELGLRVIDRYVKIFRLEESRARAEVDAGGDQGALRAKVLGELAEREGQLRGDAG
jgi:hypothetical protein